MGNTKSSAAEIDDNPLNKDERVSLEKFYSNFMIENKPSKDTFCSIFHSSQYTNFGTSCYSYIVDDQSMSLSSFQTFVIDVARSTSTKTLQIIWNIIQSDPTVSEDQTLDYFFRLVLEFSGCEHDGLDITATRLSNHVRRTCHKDQSDVVQCGTLINWTNEYAPYTAKVFVTYINRKCFGDLELQYTPFNPPILNGGSSVLTQSDLMPLALYDKSLQGGWKKLYTTQQDGLSFNRIAHHILGYSGPSLILIKCSGSDVVIGAYNEDRWRDSNRFYGNSASFLCALAPDMKIFRSKADSNQHYQWLNMKSYGMPHGLGMGGSLEKFRLFIPDTLEECVAHSSCLTYEPGAFIDSSSSGSFDIDVMEVWGCGGEAAVQEALTAQAKDRGERDDMIRKARQVDKAAFANNSFDQEFLLPKNYSHKVRMVDDAAASTLEADSKRNDENKTE
mmetsp:Transcript_8466/g.12630  ORF Transcript_8466/g.12630 Transcript_8466/m.12630 type:complete len:447 (-) Transcript_8466:195-1535(-)